MNAETINRTYPGAEVIAITQVFNNGWNNVSVDDPKYFGSYLNELNHQEVRMVQLHIKDANGFDHYPDFGVYELLS